MMPGALIPRVLKVSKEELGQSVVWEPMGRSPGNTPMAKIQFVQTLLPFVNDPSTGIDKWELVHVLLTNGPLDNARGVQKSKEDMIAEQQQAAMAQSGGLGAPNPANAMPGMAPPQGVPSGAPGLPPGPMPFHGPNLPMHGPF